MDETFGSVVKVISPTRSLHGYSTPSPLSATGRYAMLWMNGDQTNIVDTTTSTVVFQNRPGTVTYETPRWDALNDDVYYFFSGTSIKKHVLSTNTTVTVTDYSIPTPTTKRFTAIQNGGTGDGSKDNWLSFFAPNEHNICVINLNANKTYCGEYNSALVSGKIPISWIDYSMTTKGVDSETGKRLVLAMAFPSLAAFSVDEAKGRLKFEFRGPEYPSYLQGAYGAHNNYNGACDPNEICLSAPHADVFENTDGKQYLALELDYEGSSFAPCSRRVTALQLSKGSKMLELAANGGGLISIMATNYCGTDDTLIADHVNCSKHSAVCAYSANYADWFALDPAQPNAAVIPRFPHESEVFVVRGLGLEVRRLAQLHTIRFADDTYWSTARAGLSGDGKFVLWDSNFYRSNQEQAVMTSTGW